LAYGITQGPKYSPIGNGRTGQTLGFFTTSEECDVGSPAGMGFIPDLVSRLKVSHKAIKSKGKPVGNFHVACERKRAAVSAALGDNFIFG
jgi:hypothetical protein